jgi:hypothetical protein
LEPAPRPSRAFIAESFHLRILRLQFLEDIGIAEAERRAVP